MIYKRYTRSGDTRWVVKVYIGQSADGRKLDKHIGTFGTRREAKAAEADAVKQFATKSGNETIAEFADRWLDDYPRERNSTRRCHEQAIKKFIAAHGKRLPQTITRQEARKWAMAHRSSHASLRAMWQDMLNENIVATNPWANLRLPQSKGRADTDPPSAAQLDRLMVVARKLKPGPHGEQYASMIEFAAYTGMRRGEVCVLEWRDVNFKHSRVRVTKTLSDDREILPPKNGKARTIVLAPQAAAALKRLPRPLDDSARIFSTPNGRRYSKSTWHYHWNPVRVGADMPALDWHELRHYCATYMRYVLGLTREQAAGQLGHTDGGWLIDKLYAHADDDAMLYAIEQAFRDAGRPDDDDAAGGVLVPLGGPR